MTVDSSGQNMFGKFHPVLSYLRNFGNNDSYIGESMQWSQYLVFSCALYITF